MGKILIQFSELSERVIEQLREHGYMDSTLVTYRRFFNRIHVFINQLGTDTYSSEAGKRFLESINVCPDTFVAYKCAVRRLDDYIGGKPYRCHHIGLSNEVVSAYAEILDAYLDECLEKGNSPCTIAKKKKACITFLNYVFHSGCKDLSLLEIGLVSRALLIFKNKGNYSTIKLFLKYLSKKGITVSDLSGIVPSHRRPQILPTTYTPSEISRIESAVNKNTNTGKRNLAILLLATRMGLRSGDIAAMKWTSIDFVTGYINLVQEKTKTPLSLQMPYEVSEAMTRYRNSLPHMPEDGFVFHSMSAPYGRITTSIIRHMVTEGFTDAGVDTSGKKHGPHAFRSSLASSMVNDGGSYETVRKILGHNDPNVIKHYARTDIENLRLCALEPPASSGLFAGFLSGRMVISHV